VLELVVLKVSGDAVETPVECVIVPTEVVLIVFGKVAEEETEIAVEEETEIVLIDVEIVAIPEVDDTDDTCSVDDKVEAEMRLVDEVEAKTELDEVDEGMFSVEVEIEMWLVDNEVEI
jgi:hypothetical protein